MLSFVEIFVLRVVAMQERKTNGLQSLDFSVTFFTVNSEYLQCSVVVYFAYCKGGMADVYFVTPLCHINLYYPANTNKHRLIFHYVFNHELVRKRQTLSVFLIPRSISICSTGIRV